MRATPTFLVAIVVCLGCGSDPAPKPAPAAQATSSSASRLAEATPPAPTPPPVAALPSEADRDPFAQPILPTTAPPPSDLARKAKKYSVDQLRLVGIVGGEEQARAMFVDPRGKGWIVERGDRVGRAELRVDHFTGWRVDRIRHDDVVLVREDAAHAEQSAETRVLALHTSPEPLDIDD